MFHWNRDLWISRWRVSHSVGRPKNYPSSDRSHSLAMDDYTKFKFRKFDLIARLLIKFNIGGRSSLELPHLLWENLCATTIGRGEDVHRMDDCSIAKWKASSRIEVIVQTNRHLRKTKNEKMEMRKGNEKLSKYCCSAQTLTQLTHKVFSERWIYDSVLTIQFLFAAFKINCANNRYWGRSKMNGSVISLLSNCFSRNSHFWYFRTENKWKKINGIYLIWSRN